MKAFISYSHADAKHLERLHKHLAMLRRDGSLKDWTDNEVLPGGKIDAEISAGLHDSELFIAMASADYLASNYCYDKEFEEALRRNGTGSLRIVPVILEPCDWLSSPLRQFKALPKDGLPISEWTNLNNAYLDVATGLRKVLAVATQQLESSNSILEPPTRERRIRVKQDYDVLEKRDFADKVFSVVKSYFDKSCDELSSIPGLKARFDIVDGNAFTCTVVNRSVSGGREAHITVRNSKGAGHFGDINYAFQAYADGNTSNGNISIESDDFNLYATLNNFGGHTHDQAKLGATQVAEMLWLEFVKNVGIDYD